MKIEIELTDEMITEAKRTKDHGTSCNVALARALLDALPQSTLQERAYNVLYPNYHDAHWKSERWDVDVAVISTEPVKGWAWRGSVANRTPKYQSPAPTAVSSIAATRADSEAMAMKASTANPSWKMANNPSHFNNAARKRPEDS